MIWAAGWQLPWLGFAKVAGGAQEWAPRGGPGSWKHSICHEDALRYHEDGITGLLHTLWACAEFWLLPNQICQLEFHNSHSRTLFVSKITFGNNLSRAQPTSVWKPPAEVQLRKFSLPVRLSLCLSYSLVSNLFSEWSDFSSMNWNDEVMF